MQPKKLRIKKSASLHVQSFVAGGKPVAMICHGTWTLNEVGKLCGRRLACWHSLQTKLDIAGADWADREMVVNDNLVSRRKPNDIPAFSCALTRLPGVPNKIDHPPARASDFGSVDKLSGDMGNWTGGDMRNWTFF